VLLGLILLCANATHLALGHRYGWSDRGGPTGRRMTIEGLEFVEIRAGYFWMGSHWLCERGNWLGRMSEPLGLPFGRAPKHYSGLDAECPVRLIEIDHSFWMSATEVTHEVFDRVLESDGGSEEEFLRWVLRLSSPAESADGEDLMDTARRPILCQLSSATEFCDGLSKRSGFSCRLPLECEWEYVCRAGTSSEWYSGSEPDTCLTETAWTFENSQWPLRPMPVAEKSPNPWGLYDMLGNAEEWSLPGTEISSVDVQAVLRGGSIYDSVAGCRSSIRNRDLSRFLTDKPAPSLVGGIRVLVVVE